LGRLGAGQANASRPARALRQARQQLGIESGLGAPAGRLLHAARALDLHGASVGLPAQRATLSINGLGDWHGGVFQVLVRG